MLRCSFCKRPQHEVGKLIAGPGVYICDRCSGEANALRTGEPSEGLALLGADDRPTTCDFCGKPSTDVEALVKGDANAICSTCLELCAQILLESSPP